MRFFSNLILVSVALLLCGCVALPLNNEAIDDPALKEISRAYENAIASAKNDPDREWQSGWLGNMWIHFNDKQNPGLCYEWKYLVHAGVSDTVKKVGWHIRGIAIYEKTPDEHHAVLVFDPAQVKQAELLTNPSDQPAFVLDAWRQGRADIYPLSDWLPSSPGANFSPRIFMIEKKN